MSHSCIVSKASICCDDQRSFGLRPLRAVDIICMCLWNAHSFEPPTSVRGRGGGFVFLRSWLAGSLRVSSILSNGLLDVFRKLVAGVCTHRPHLVGYFDQELENQELDVGVFQQRPHVVEEVSPAFVLLVVRLSADGSSRRSCSTWRSSFLERCVDRTVEGTTANALCGAVMQHSPALRRLVPTGEATRSIDRFLTTTTCFSRRRYVRAETRLASSSTRSLESSESCAPPIHTSKPNAREALRRLSVVVRWRVV